MRTAMKLLLVVGLAAVFAASALAQGVYWESIVLLKGKEEGKDMVTKSYYAPKRMKVESGRDEYLIFRMDQEKIYTVKPEDKTYYVMTFKDIEQVGKKVNAEMAKLEEQMKQMPEEQRKMMEQMMGDRMPGKKKPHKFDVKKTGEKRAISGYACVKYVVTDNGKQSMTLWVTPEVKAFAMMRDDMLEQTKRMAAFAQEMGGGMVEAMQKIDGFPIEVEMSDQMTTRVTKLEQRSIAASEFEIPAGYKEVPSPMKEQMKGMEK